MDTILLSILMVAQAQALVADDDLIITMANQLAAADCRIQELEDAIFEYKSILAKLGL